MLTKSGFRDHNVRKKQTKRHQSEKNERREKGNN